MMTRVAPIVLGVPLALDPEPLLLAWLGRRTSYEPLAWTFPFASCGKKARTSARYVTNCFEEVMLQPLASQFTGTLGLLRGIPWIEYPVFGPPLSGLKNPLWPDPAWPGILPIVSIVCQ